MKDEAPASPKDAALRLALEGFENIRHHFDTDEYAYDVAVKSITAIKQALEETPRVSPEPEPVAWMRHDGSRVTTAADRKNYPDYETRYPIPLYTSPPKREPVATNDTSQKPVDETSKQRHEPEPGFPQTEKNT